MDPIEKLERKRAAQRLLLAQRRRAGLLRRRVVAISLIAFVLLWGVVFGQMVSGNDPVLGNSVSTTAAPSAAVAAKEAIETSEPEELEPEVVEPQPVEEEPIELEPEPEPAPVTTSQS